MKFFGVQGPSQIEAWVNKGDEKGLGKTKIDDQEIQVIPEKIPAYGISKDIKLAGKTDTSDGKTYEMYEAKVEMKIPVARLEISGITHKHADVDADCKYSELSIDGIYLDKVSTTLGGEVVDYSWPAEPDGAQLPILKDDIEAPNNFLSDNVWPAQQDPAQAYAYNFYPSEGQQPLVKIYFENATANFFIIYSRTTNY